MCVYEIKIVYLAHKYFLEAKSDLAAAKEIILVKKGEIQIGSLSPFLLESISTKIQSLLDSRGLFSVRRNYRKRKNMTLYTK